MKTLTVKSPEVKSEIEHAFTVKGKKYYCFKRDTAMRYGRYMVLQAFLQEYYLRVSLEVLQRDIAQLKKWLNPPINQKGESRIEMGKALELLEIMEQRTKIAFEPETVYRLASCVYFDDKENILSYDRKYNEAKIASWKREGSVDFFYHKLFQELTLLTAISKDDLENFLRDVPKLLKGWSMMEDILMR